MKHYFLISFFAFISFTVNAQYVVDKAGLLNSSEISLLNKKIKDIKEKTLVEILIYIAVDLEGKTPKEYGLELSNTYNAGLKGINNGVIILISINDRQLQILNGYGMEWIIDDQYSQAIVDQMIPYLSNQEYYKSFEESLSMINVKASGVDWNIALANINEINATHNGKIIKFNYTHKGKKVFKYPLDSDPQFDKDFKIKLEFGDKKYSLFYSKYMKDYISKIITKRDITIYARIKDSDTKKLELLGIELKTSHN